MSCSGDTQDNQLIQDSVVIKSVHASLKDEMVVNYL